MKKTQPTDTNKSISAVVNARSNTLPNDSLYNQIPTLCFIVNTQLHISSINAFGCQQLGYQQDELLDKDVSILCANKDKTNFLKHIGQSFIDTSAPSKRFEIMQKRKDGSLYWVRNITRIIYYQNQKHVLILSEDITETRHLIHELEQQNALDSLTGLLSRRRFDRELEQIVTSVKTHKTKHTICFIDLDQFKVVNDSGGHQAGDELLKNISLLLKNTIRSGDTLARLGGDEFGLILKHCSINEAKVICEKIISTLSQYRFSWNNDIFSIGCSIGILEINSNSPNAAELLRQADSACYAAKDKGRNCIHVFHHSASETERRGQLMRWSSRLTTALTNNQFELHVQSIVPIQPYKKSTPTFEVLVRMVDEFGQLIYPGAFISAAEYYGTAVKLDLWVTKKAIELAVSKHCDSKLNDIKNKSTLNSNTKKQQAHSNKTLYFINLSGITLGDNTFIKEITNLLSEISPYNFTICFEITESAAIQNINTALYFIEHFRQLGCMFALDDFGSGFSSFTYLKELPIDFIKIDGAFVKAIKHSSTERAIVKAIQEIAVAFDIQTIAEHIENEDTLQELIKIGVEFAQGYYLHKPEHLNANSLNKSINDEYKT